MASAKKYSWTLKNGRKREAWRARWVDAAGGQRERKGFDRESDALAYANDREAEARHGVVLAGERPTGRTTVEAWAKTWLEAQEVRASTLDSYRYAVKRINATFGGRSLASLRASEIKAWRRGLLSRYAPTTAEQTAAIFAMLLRAAALDDLIDKSPMPPAKGGTGRVVDPDELLTLDQVHAWAGKMPDVARAMPLVAATTGLRQGELLGLQKHRVDFLGRELRVDGLDGQLVSPIGKGRPEFGPPKTPAAARTVPLVDETTEALAAHLGLQPAVAGEPLFRSRRGYRWRRSTFGDVWRTAAADAKLPKWVHWHSLRDFYASSLIRSGLDLRTVMTLMGHASSEETLRTYARLWPDAQDRARKALEDLWRPDDGQGMGTEGGAGR